MALVRTEFEQQLFLSLPAMQNMFSSYAFRPGFRSSRFAQDLQQAEEDAQNLFLNEDYDNVVKTLGKAIEELRWNRIVVAKDLKYRELAFQAQLLYAIACTRQATAALAKSKEQSDANHPDAAASLRKKAIKATEESDVMMSELIRSFPFRIITAKKYGNEAELLYKRNRAVLNRTGSGKITVSVNDPEVVIYVYESVQGTGKISRGGYYPGICRVLVQGPTDESREYDVEVRANEETKLDIDWNLGSVFVVSNWIGFAYHDETEHAREAAVVRQVMQPYPKIRFAMTVTVTTAHRHPAVIATLYEAHTGELVRSHIAELTGKTAQADENALHELNYCMLDGLKTGCLDVPHPEYTRPEPQVEVAPTSQASAAVAKPASLTSARPTSNEQQHPYLFPGITVGVGLASIGLGAYLQAEIKPPLAGPQSKSLYSHTGVGFMVGGGAIAVGGLYWAYYSWRTSRGRPVSGLAMPIVAVSSRAAWLGWTTVF